MRAPVLFTHIVGVLLLFLALAAEWEARHRLRRAASLAEPTSWLTFFSVIAGLYATAGATILLTGAYLATNVGVWQFGWIRVSMPTVIVITVLGIVSALRMRKISRSAVTPNGDMVVAVRRVRGSWLAASVDVRGTAALGVLYVMVAKPDLLLALAIVATATLAGAIISFASRHRRRAPDAAPWPSRDIGRYARREA